MNDLGRRTFLKRSAVALGGVAVGGCAEPPADSTRAALDARLVRAVSRLVLPSELGDERLERSILGFEEWLDGFDPVAELPHGYGSQEIRYGPPDPAPRWTAQLEALDLEAKKRFGKGFTSLDVPRQRELLERQLSATDPGTDELPGQPARAEHVAVGMLAWFYGTSEATDLCYERRIGAFTCRPLAAAPDEPVPRADGT
jgi:hypothetical protein